MDWTLEQAYEKLEESYTKQIHPIVRELYPSKTHTDFTTLDTRQESIQRTALFYLEHPHNIHEKFGSRDYQYKARSLARDYYNKASIKNSIPTDPVIIDGGNADTELGDFDFDSSGLWDTSASSDDEPDVLCLGHSVNNDKIITRGVSEHLLSLSLKQAEIAYLIVECYLTGEHISQQKIAKQLGISERMVRKHIDKACETIYQDEPELRPHYRKMQKSKKYTFDPERPAYNHNTNFYDAWEELDIRACHNPRSRGCGRQ